MWVPPRFLRPTTFPPPSPSHTRYGLVACALVRRLQEKKAQPTRAGGRLLSHQAYSLGDATLVGLWRSRLTDCPIIFARSPACHPNRLPTVWLPSGDYGERAPCCGLLQRSNASFARDAVPSLMSALRRVKHSSKWLPRAL